MKYIVWFQSRAEATDTLYTLSPLPPPLPQHKLPGYNNEGKMWELMDHFSEVTLLLPFHVYFSNCLIE